MSVIALTSVTGSPGVTTLAVGWAYRNPKPTLVVEAGADGGSAVLAGVFRSQVKHTTSILNLAELVGQPMTEYLWEHTVLLPTTSDRWLLPGVATHQQARALIPAWTPIAHTLHDISRQAGVDVIVDCGRLTAEYAPTPLLLAADAALVVVDETLPSLNACVIALGPLREDLDNTGGAQRLGVVPVVGRRPGRQIQERLRDLVDGGKDRPFTLDEIAAVFQPTPTLPPLTYDPDAASVFYAGTLTPRKFDEGSYCRSIDAVRAAAAALIRASDELSGRATA